MPNHDILIVGGGIAGLRAAIEAKREALDVAIVSKTHPLRSHSCTAQAGMNAAVKPGDSWQDFAAETIKAGDYLNDQGSVEVLCREAAERVLELDAMGVPFSREPGGRLDVRRLPGASQPRAIFAGDITGQVILHTLYEQVIKAGISTYDEVYVTDLLLSDSSCQGVVATDFRTGQIFPIGAKGVVLATGGFGQMYQNSTTSLSCTGDGIALAYRSGVQLMDMEMVQFHPTALASTGVLVTEAVLGEGAKLRTSDGVISPELAPRDIIVRAMQQQGSVVLDASGLDEARASKTLKHTRHLVQARAGVDILREPVAVAPAMHRNMGGILVDLDGATSIEGLFAAGECASSGAHGANVLGGNTLTDSLVFGRRAGLAAGRYASEISAVPVTKWSASNAAGKETPQVRKASSGEVRPSQIRKQLQALMCENFGITRNAAGLKEGIDGIRQLSEKIVEARISDRGEIFNWGILQHQEVVNMLLCAEAVAVTALAREESRGTHSRSDHLERDDTHWLKHSLVTLEDGAPKCATTDVKVTQWKPGAREY